MSSLGIRMSSGCSSIIGSLMSRSRSSNGSSSVIISLMNRASLVFVGLVVVRLVEAQPLAA